jgi:hypothetical protein
MGTFTRRGSRRVLAGAVVASVASFLAPSVASADWLINTYKDNLQIVSQEIADKVIAGFNNQFAPVTANYTSANTQDNGATGFNGFPLGFQIAGLPPGDNNDFAFVGTGTLNVTVAGNYTFTNNTDDGSRLRVSVNGGPLNQVITDNVLSGPHDVTSAPVALNPGDAVNFQWTWFERGGGAEGSLSYQRNGNDRVLVGDGSEGLTLNGGNLSGTLYKLNSPPGTTIDSLGKALSVSGSAANKVDTYSAPAFNFLNSGGDGHFGGGVNTPLFNNRDIDDFVTRGTGFLRVTIEGDYKFASLSDDGAQFLLMSPDGSSTIASIIDDTLHGAGDPGDIKYSGVVHLTPGFYPIDYLFFERGGGASGELFTVDPSTNAYGDLVGNATPGGNLEVVQAVPEPGTLSVLALAAAAGLRRRRRA